MGEIVIRDYLEEGTTDINSPDIIIVPTLWEDISALRNNYGVSINAAVSAYQWGYVYIRVRNNSGLTLQNLYVTASFSNDPAEKNNRRKALQTVEGLTSSYIAKLGPGEWAITEQPFVLDRTGEESRVIYVRACEGSAEFPCNDGSSAESYVSFSVLKGSIAGKIQEGFLPVVNYQNMAARVKLKVNIDVMLSETQESNVVPITEIYNQVLGIHSQYEGRQFELCFDVPSDCSETIYYSMLIPEEQMSDESGSECSEDSIKQKLAIVFECSKED